MATSKKHGSCLAHPKLPCGCKVCETPQSTYHNLGALALTAFHADIHRIQAQHDAARPRLAGSGTFVPLRHWMPSEGRYIPDDEWMAKRTTSQGYAA